MVGPRPLTSGRVLTHPEVTGSAPTVLGPLSMLLRRSASHTRRPTRSRPATAAVPPPPALAAAARQAHGGLVGAGGHGERNATIKHQARNRATKARSRPARSFSILVSSKPAPCAKASAAAAWWGAIS